MKSRPDVYLKFLSLTAEAPSDIAPLDPLENRIVHIVALAGYKHERLSVSDLLARSELASRATLHSRLKSMHKKGWLRFADTEDSRRKQLELTTAAHRHLEWLSECFLRALSD